MNKKTLINSNIERFYTYASEETRLDTGMGIFEFERVKSLIDRYLPSISSIVLDIGGGTGKYSAWMAQKGHTVHLIEPVNKHLYLAKNRSQKLKNPFIIQPGEAQKLSFPDNYADVVILHGPLYHLQKKDDRERAIREAKRVVKKGGQVLGFGINHSASTLAGLLNGCIHKESFFQMCREELTTGLHNPPDEFPWLLAEAFYHTPQKLKDEFLEAGLQYINTYAVEGLIWLDANYFTHMEHKRRRNTLMELLKITENDPSLLALSPHIMVAAKK